jgi:hypothetical protein
MEASTAKTPRTPREKYIKKEQEADPRKRFDSGSYSPDPWKGI